MIALTECPFESLDKYNAIEMHPVEEANGNCEQVDEAKIGLNPDAHYYWGVYLHLTEGGLEWVADFTTKDKAEAFANGLQFMLAAVIQDKLVPMR